ncbi:MAG: hypothetical protein LBP62_08245 [Clostridiales bacterium]|jgi:hypothetical protein|nr:hypothetical protein [Clostridiales bacterium]
MVCIGCGREIGGGEQYCKHCGFKSDVTYARNGGGASGGGAKAKKRKAAGAEYGWDSFAQVKGGALEGYYQPAVIKRRGLCARKPRVSKVYDGAAVVSLFIAAAALVCAFLGVFGVAVVPYAGAALAVAAVIAAFAEKRKNFNYTYVGIALGIIAFFGSVYGIFIGL